MKANTPEILQFLDSQRRDHSKLFIDARNQENKFTFEDYQQWLPQLFQQIISLGKEILAYENKVSSTTSANNNILSGGQGYLMENSIYFPLSMIIEEIEEIISFIRFPSLTDLNKSGALPVQLLHEFRQHYSFGYQLISNLQLSSSIIIEYYFMIFNRWVTKTYDKQLQLLMIIIYLLLEWIRKTNE